MTWYLEKGQVCAAKEDFLLVFPSIVAHCSLLNDIWTCVWGCTCFQTQQAPCKSSEPPRFHPPSCGWLVRDVPQAGSGVLEGRRIPSSMTEAAR